MKFLPPGDLITGPLLAAMKAALALLLVAVSFALTASQADSFVVREPSSENPDVAEGTVASQQTSGTAEIRILGVNDFHGNLESPKEVDGRPVGGAAHLSAYLDALEGRKETVRVHAGDMVGASPLASAHYGDEPAIRAMNQMDFDVGVVGNHEFDRGVTEMSRLIEGGENAGSGADFPYLAANVVDRSTGESILPAYEVREVDGVKVGFIGVTTLETPEITDPAVGESLRFLDLSDTVNRYVGELRSRNVETILVLAHSGGSETDGRVSGEISGETKQMSDAVDVVVSGHSHTRIDARIDGKTIVQSGEYGEAVSVVDLDVDRLSGEVLASSSKLVTTYNDALPPDREMLALTNRYVRGVSELANRPLGVTTEEITRAPTYSGENALGDLIADARRQHTGADFAFVLSGALRDDIPAGEISYGQLFAASPATNDLMVTELTGRQVREVLEAQFRPERDRRLQISGFTYTYDPDRPYGERVTSMTLPDGSPAAADTTYTVAAPEFISLGGNGFGVFRDGGEQRRVGSELDAVVSYVESLPEPFEPPDPTVQPRISLS